MFVKNNTISAIEVEDLGITLEVGINDLRSISSDDIKNSDNLYSLISQETVIVVDSSGLEVDKNVVLNNFDTGHGHTWDDISNKPENYPPTPHTHLQYATISGVDARIQKIVDSAPAALDTLNEIATRLEGDQSTIDAITAELANKSNIGHVHNQYCLISLLDTTVSGLSPKVHFHNDLYYLKPEIRTYLNNKADINHNHDYKSLFNLPEDDNFNDLTLTTHSFSADTIPIYSILESKYKKIKKIDLLGDVITSSLQYLQMQYRVPIYEHGGTMTKGYWRTRPINTVTYNSIPEAELIDNHIILPAGTYWITAAVISYNIRANIVGISFSDNFDDPFIVGPSFDANFHMNMVSTCSGYYIFQSEVKIHLVQMCERTVRSYGMGKSLYKKLNLKHNIFANIQIWRLT